MAGVSDSGHRSSAAPQQRGTLPLAPIDAILKGMDDPFRSSPRNCRRLCRCLANRWAMPIVALLVAVAWPGGVRAMDEDRAVKLAREFLASDDGDKREQ